MRWIGRRWGTLALLAALAAAPGCATSRDDPVEPASAEAPAATSDSGNTGGAGAPVAVGHEPDASPREIFRSPGDDYFEFEHDGRLFVLGDPSAVAEFVRNPKIPASRTLVGWGPRGETVVFQIDRGDGSLYARLLEGFESRVRILTWDFEAAYFEFLFAGRYYVLGSEAGARGFESSPHLSVARTYVGAGPGGRTVVIEAEREDGGLLGRLRGEFVRRHEWELP